MVELKHDALVFSFPEVHRDAELRVEFLRTPRIPEDDRVYAVPAVGRLPVRHVQEFAASASPAWVAREGVMLPLYAGDALRLSFASLWEYPFAVQVAVGRKDALSGRPWRDRLHYDPQNYLVVPDRQRLDGWSDASRLHQFAGWLANEAPPDAATEHLTVLLAVHPMSRAAYDRRRRAGALSSGAASPVCFEGERELDPVPLQQDIERDPYDFGDWDERRARCLVYLVSARGWRAITGSEPPLPPLAPDDYARAGIPWLDTYAADAKPYPRQAPL
ncbi:MAG TPA: hypothetical protein VFZ69_08205 [Longimicrobiales bacterium]